MPPSVTVLALHGIGTYADEAGNLEPYARDLEQSVRALLPEDLDAQVRFRPVYWSNHRLLDAQRQLLKERHPGWVWRWLFRFVVSGLADATAFQLPPSAKTGDWRAYRASTYAAIQRAVREALAAAEQEAGGGPVVVVAQSMGCHVLSQYAWDAAEEPERLLAEGEDPSVLSDFVRLRTLHSAVFTGCNIPILTMDVARDRKVPLDMPGRGPGSVWLNLYDPDDALGYDLAPEYASYYGVEDAPPFTGERPADRDPVSEVRPADDALEVRTIGGLTPFAHRAYWRQARVHRAVAAAIEGAATDSAPAGFAPVDDADQATDPSVLS